MRTRLRRFAAVAVSVTVLDIGLLLVLDTVGVAAPIADAASIAVAAVASYLLNRSITFADDPHVRWVGQPRVYALVAGAAGAVDVAVLTVVLAVAGSSGTAALLVAKSVGLLLAGVVRFAAYRSMLFTSVQRLQSEPARRTPPPGDVRLTVVVPAFREGERLVGSVAGLRAALTDAVGADGVEIVVVDDGSGDDTAERARAAGADQVLAHPENRGKGAAVRTGVLAARGRTIAFTDADSSYPPDQILLLQELVEAGWDAVVGSRRHVDTVTLVRAGRLREVSGRLFNVLTGAVLLGRYRDTQCGLKAFRSDVAHLLFSRTLVDGFAFDVELFHLVERYRLSLTEVPVSLVGRRGSTVRLGADARRMVRDLFRIRRWAGEGRYDLTREEAARWTPGVENRTN